MELINASNNERIKDILLNTQLVRPICVEVPSMQLKIEFDGVSTSEPNDIYDMKQTYFIKGEETKVMSVKERTYEMFFNLGEWGYSTRIPNSHICLGTTPIKFGSDYFAQLELSQALEDGSKIYIVKNISKLAGEGAISRINKGLGKNKDDKHQRRKELVKSLDKKVINFDKQEWMCLIEINKADLFEDEKAGDIINDFMENFIEYALKIEEMINDASLE